MNPLTSTRRAATTQTNGHRKKPKNGSATNGRTLTVSMTMPAGVQVDEPTAKRLLTLALVSSGHLSQSQAAQSLHVLRYDLIEMMGEHSLPIVRLSAEEAATEQRHLRELQTLRGTRTRAVRAALP